MSGDVKLKIQKVQKKYNGVEKFDPQKIYSAIFKSFQSVYGIDGKFSKQVEKVYDRVLKKLEKYEDSIISVDDIDNFVEESLASLKEFRVLTAYITHRIHKISEKRIREEIEVKDDIGLTTTALNLLKKRYLFKDNKGNIIETPKQMFKRVAKYLSLADAIYDEEIYKQGELIVYDEKSIFKVPKNIEEIMDLEIPREVYSKLSFSAPIDKKSLLDYGLSVAELEALARTWFFNNLEGRTKKSLEDTLRYIAEHRPSYSSLYRVLVNRDALFNSPALINAGRDFGTLAACYLLEIQDDMKAILDALKTGGLIYKAGGGVGYYFGHLREKGALINTTKGKTQGPLSFMELFNTLGLVVKQAAVRDAAALAALPDWHPDVMDFIDSKAYDNSKFTGFNISVTISRKFLRAVENNEIWELKSPSTGEVVKKIPAVDMWNKIIQNAHRSAEPGILFVDEANADNPILDEKLKGTNPCVTGDTLILTKNGPMKMKDIVEKGEDVDVYTLADNGEIVIRTLRNPRMTYKAKQIYKVVLYNGQTLRVSEDHKFILADGTEKMAKDLEFGDMLEGRVFKNGEVTNYDYTKDLFLKSPEMTRAEKQGYQVIVTNLGKVLVRKRCKVCGKKFSVRYHDRDIDICSPACLTEYKLNNKNIDGISVVLWDKKKTYGTRTLRNDIDKIEAYIEAQLYAGRPPTYDGEYKFTSDMRKVSVVPLHSKSKRNKGFKSFYELRYFVETIGLRVERVEPDGIEPVYNGTVDKTHKYMIGTDGYDTFFVTRNCGEIWLFDKESCNLASINLSNMVDNDGKFNWRKFRSTIRLMIRMLDNVIDMNRFPDYAIYESVRKYRRLGLGVMGYADMLIKMGIRYGSKEALRFTHELGKVFLEESVKTSAELAKTRGVFPRWYASVFQKIIDEGREAIDKYKPEGKGIAQYKFKREVWEKYPFVRNVAVTTVAPCGSISIIAGVSSSIEPIFSFVYTRRMIDIMYVDVHPLFKELLQKEGIYSDELIDKVAQEISVQNIVEIPERLRKVLVTTYDVTPEEHVYTQAVWQQYITNSISKCLVEGQLMLTNKGIIPIEKCGYASKPDSFDKPLKDLYVVDKDGKFRRVLNHYYGGKQHCTEVRLSDGSVIKGATNTHKILTVDGWKALNEVSVGDLVIVKHTFSPVHTEGNLPIDYDVTFRTNANVLGFPHTMTPDLAKWLGMIVADGHISIKAGKVGLVEKSNEGVGKVFDELTYKLFKKHNKVETDKRNGVRTHFLTSRELSRYVASLIGKGARDKHVPEQILMGSREEKIAFIEGLTLDGYYKKDYGLCVYDGRSERLAREVAMLLRSFGLNLIYQGVKIDSFGKNHYVFISNELQELINPIERHKKGKTVWKKYYVLVDVDYGNFKVPANHPIYGTFSAMRRTKRYYCYNTTAEQLNLPVVAEVRKVTAVNDIGMQNVYDVEVEDSHSYVVDGIVSHNTINLPASATPSDVERAYKLAAKHRCKGITVYRESSREGVILAGKKLKENEEKKKPSIELNVRTKVVAEEDYAGGCPTCHT